jgi:hypothetical protein
MSDFTEFIKKAAECLALSRRATDPQDRLFLIDLAARWRELANSVRKTEELVETIARIRFDESAPSEPPVPDET